MGNVSLEESGLHFVKICLENYWGTLSFFGIFIACIFGIWMLRKKEAQFFVPYTVFLFFTIYNPVLVKYFYSKLGSDSIYYRFFWLLPVSIVVGYFCVQVISCTKKGFSKCLAALAICAAIMLSGSQIKSLSGSLSLPANLYKVPDSLLEMSSVIHEDSDIPNPKVAAESNMHMYLRQYDPSLKLSISRNNLLYYTGNRAVSANEESRKYQEQTAILAVILYGDQSNTEAFLSAVEHTETNYLILLTNPATNDYLTQLGFGNLGEYGSYTLYRTFI